MSNKNICDSASTFDIASQQFPRNKTINRYQNNPVYLRSRRNKSQTKEHSFSVKKVQERQYPKKDIYYQHSRQGLQAPHSSLGTRVNRRKNKYNHMSYHQPSFIMKTQECPSQNSHNLESIIKKLDQPYNPLNLEQTPPFIISHQEYCPSDRASQSSQKQDLIVQPSKQLFLCNICLQFYLNVEIKSHLEYCIPPTMLTQYLDKWRKLSQLLQVASSKKSSPELNIVAEYMEKMSQQKLSKSGKFNFMRRFGIDTSRQKEKLVESLELKMKMIRWVVTRLKPTVFYPQNLQRIIEQIWAKIIKLSH